MKKFTEYLMHAVFFLTACVSVLAVVLICIFLFKNGFSAISQIGLVNFLTGTEWKPKNNIFGILPMIIGSIYVTIGAVVIGMPIGILCAIFLAKFCPQALYRIIKPVVNLMASIPSVVYGFFGLMLIVPFFQEIFGSSGKGLLTASVILGIMILPTVISVSEAALRAVPDSYFEGALALGATKEKSVLFTVVPAAKSGILAGVVLGIGRAIGETMAVIMVAGNQPQIPHSLLDGVRTMTANIVIEMGYATDLHREALVATAVVLFVFILIINLCVSLLRSRSSDRS